MTAGDPPTRRGPGEHLHCCLLCRVQLSGRTKQRPQRIDLVRRVEREPLRLGETQTASGDLRRHRNGRSRG